MSSMALDVQVLALLWVSCYNFGQSYILLAQFHKDHPGKCSLEEVDLNPPLPKLNVKSMDVDQIIGTEYDKNKNYCNKLSCSVWKNHKGQGYRLENIGCAPIVKRPSNCTKYTKQDNKLPWPECCYFRICPKVRDEL